MSFCIFSPFSSCLHLQWSITMNVFKEFVPFSWVLNVFVFFIFRDFFAQFGSGDALFACLIFLFCENVNPNIPEGHTKVWNYDGIVPLSLYVCHLQICIDTELSVITWIIYVVDTSRKKHNRDQSLFKKKKTPFFVRWGLVFDWKTKTRVNRD